MSRSPIHSTNERSARIPRATYRIQINENFPLRDARALVPYLDQLGIGDLYLSPPFQARPGSSHGYDLVDHNAISSALGGRSALEELSRELCRRRMGLVVDFVPNHMGIGPHNAWWRDVLENGPSSVFASHFDIDWRPPKDALKDRVLLPFLGDHYGRVLEGGQVRLRLDGGAFVASVYGIDLPLAPQTWVPLLDPPLADVTASLGPDDHAVLELASISTGLAHLPATADTRPAQRIERRREKEILKQRLAALVDASPPIAAAIRARLERMNGTVGEPRSFDLLHALLEAQPYRLSYWRVAGEEINYRRFFDESDLAAIRMEQPEVFRAAHGLLLDLVAGGVVTGVRVDHPDGLWDPAGYFQALEDEGRRARSAASPPDSGAREAGRSRPLYVVAEKILARGETLPDDWRVHGTSGYDFASLCTALFVDSSGEARASAIYERFTGEKHDFQELIYRSKRLILKTSLAGELNVLAAALQRIAERNRHTRDFTLRALTDALREVIACFPVYRTYVREGAGEVAPRDRAAVGVAVRLAAHRSPMIDASLYDFTRSVLLLDIPDTVADEDRAAWRDLAMRVQQLTGPVMAKGLEDTAFYVYNRLVSLNEVGGEPERFGLSIDEFHRANAERARDWPHSMLTSSTHDTKRSEDVRARIDVLSEMLDDWEHALERFFATTRSLRAEVDGRLAPDANEAFLFFQSVLGTWEGSAPPAYVERLVAYMRKATKEAKVTTSWISARPAVDDAVAAFVRSSLAEDSPFVRALEPLASSLAYFGRWSSLAQLVLKATCPGVPDFYQGNETWTHRLVDPDNRAPVDFRRLGAMLEAMPRWASRALAEELVRDAADGRIKMWVTRTALDVRRRRPGTFADGSYEPSPARGGGRDHVVSFVRRSGRDVIVVVVPRLCARLTGGALVPPIGAAVWGTTSVPAPRGLYVNAFTGERVEVRDALPIATALACFPVALLESTG